MTEVFFKEKPTDDQIARYEVGVNYYLQYQHAKVRVLLRDIPTRIESYENHTHTDTTFYWIDGFEITTPEGQLVVDAHLREGIAENSLTEEHFWSDAMYIQDQMYVKLKKSIPDIKDVNDSYWKLWGLRREKGLN